MKTRNDSSLNRIFLRLMFLGIIIWIGYSVFPENNSIEVSLENDDCPEWEVERWMKLSEEIMEDSGIVSMEDLSQSNAIWLKIIYNRQKKLYPPDCLKNLNELTLDLYESFEEVEGAMENENDSLAYYYFKQAEEILDAMDKEYYRLAEKYGWED